HELRSDAPVSDAARSRRQPGAASVLGVAGRTGGGEWRDYHCPGHVAAAPESSASEVGDRLSGLNRGGQDDRGDEQRADGRYAASRTEQRAPTVAVILEPISFVRSVKALTRLSRRCS